jgi:hypothetical protein
MMLGRLELHIERLVLHGIDARDQESISLALQRELTRLFTEQGIPRSLAQGGAIAQLKVDPLTVVAGAKPDAIGVQIAQSIYSGLSPQVPHHAVAKDVGEV